MPMKGFRGQIERMTYDKPFFQKTVPQYHKYLKEAAEALESPKKKKKEKK